LHSFSRVSGSTWRNVVSKRLKLLTHRHGVTSQKTEILDYVTVKIKNSQQESGYNSYTAAEGIQYHKMQNLITNIANRDNRNLLGRYAVTTFRRTLQPSSSEESSASFLDHLTLKMKALRSFETSTQRNIPEDLNLQQCCCESLITHHPLPVQSTYSKPISFYLHSILRGSVSRPGHQLSYFSFL
jgi:hypothetical protein